MTLEKTLTVKVPDARGDTVIADAFLQFLKDNNFQVRVLALYSELLENRGYELTSEYIPIDVDLNSYIDQLIHTSLPPRTIRWYMANHGIQQLREKGFKIPDFDEEKYLPVISLTDEEDEFGSNRIRSLEDKFNKPVVLISWKSPTINRTWPREYVEKLFYETRNEITYIEFVNKQENTRIERNVVKRNSNLRQTAAILKHADGVITIDTFTLHAATAVGQKKIIGLFGSARPKTIGNYPGVLDVMEGKKVEACQYCGHHGYFKGKVLENLKQEISVLYGKKMEFSDDGCVHSGEKAFICMRAITPGKVIDAVRSYFLLC